MKDKFSIQAPIMPYAFDCNIFRRNLRSTIMNVVIIIYIIYYITYELRILVVFSVIVLIEYNIDPTLENLYSLHTN